MNNVILSGNICKDIEVKYTQSNNVEVVSNTIAVRNDYKNANGEYESQFINFVAYKNNALFISKYASKGSKILLEGRINTRNYEKEDGTKVYVTEVIADKFELLDKKKKEVAAEEYVPEIENTDLPW